MSQVVTWPHYGKNFVKTMLELAKTREQLSVVNDQFGNPTSARDLAAAIMSILIQWEDKTRAGEVCKLGEIYHCSGTGTTNWADFSRRVFQASDQYGGPFANVEGIAGSQWPTKAKRPLNSALDCSKLKRHYVIEMPPWQPSIDKIVFELLNPNKD